MADSDWSDLRVLYDLAEVVVQDPQGDWAALEDTARRRGRSACVITAWNPGRARPGQVVNDEANARLHRRLRGLHLETWPADGRSPDGSFHEPGFCVWDADHAVMLALGREFDQLAIYAVDSVGVRITVACHDEGLSRPTDGREGRTP